MNFGTIQMNSINISEQLGSKIPPHSMDCEIEVLGSLLLDSNIYDEVINIIKPNDFYNESNKRIFETIIELKEKNENIDTVILAEYLNKKNQLEQIGGVYYLSEITSKTVSSANCLTQCRIIKEYSLKRSQIVLAGRILKEAYDIGFDVFESIQTVYSALDGNLQLLTQGNLKHIKEISVGTFNHIQDMQSGKIQSIPTASPKINYLLRGGYNSINPVNFIAARPGEGKTACMINDVLYAAKKGFKVGIYSLEQTYKALILRMVSNITEIEPDLIISKKKEIYEPLMPMIIKSFEFINKLPIWIDDTSYWHVDNLVVDFKRFIKKHNLDIIFIDYLQLISGLGGNRRNRENEITYVSNKLQQSCKSNNIPFVILCQLNRTGDRANIGKKGRPSLIHLRESGGIENSADVVIALYNDENSELNQKYRAEEIKVIDGKQIIIETYKNELEKIVLKNRDGKTGYDKVLFQKNIYKMTEIEERYQEPPKSTILIPKSEPVERYFNEPEENYLDKKW